MFLNDVTQSSSAVYLLEFKNLKFLLALKYTLSPSSRLNV